MVFIGLISRVLCQIIVSGYGLGWDGKPLQVFGSRLVVPPSFRGEFIPPDQIRPSASLTQKLNAPFIQHAILIQVAGGNGVWIGALKIPLPHLVDQFSSTGSITCPELTFGKHIINFCKT